MVLVLTEKENFRFQKFFGQIFFGLEVKSKLDVGFFHEYLTINAMPNPRATDVISVDKRQTTHKNKFRFL